MNEESKNRKKRLKKRVEELKKLINSITSGEFDLRDVPKKQYNMFETRGPTRQYISPRDRSEYNYGYMEIDEMRAGNPAAK